MPKKKFIDKKNAVTFHLVHRSQQDPLAADETAPQRVLVPVGSVQAPKTEKKHVDIEKRKEEQRKYGVFYEDDYNYLQHLKDVNKVEVEWAPVEYEDNKSKNNEKKTAPKINLPSSVFASSVEEEVGLLNKAAPISGPRLDLDPDLIAAMDDDFDFDDPDNQLEDNFMELANGGGDIDDIIEEDEYEYDSDEEKDEVGSLDGPQYSFRDEETKSRFTEYSMSSSVIKRNEQLTLLDDKFEKMYAAYDEEEIGALECEEIQGHVDMDSDILLEYAAEFEKKQKEPTENVAKLMKDRLKIIDTNFSSSEDELETVEVDARKLEKDFDCKSVLSLYSDIYNHPKLISEPKKIDKLQIDKRTGIPKNILTGKPGKLTIASVAQFNRENEEGMQCDRPKSIAETMKSTISMLSVRPKNERPEERKERKQALKNYRKERRIERKANTEAFKEEKKRQEKILLNNRKNNLALFAK
ncbi:protein LTV1 homolog [Chelonus insularis]|uniref:protein LTV1 homolog n=1 Tax=Chelonus insularis TaxID=460826 RepID=UPI00158CD114|nr:protein LTV1 homolog [Chelonus insularis]